MRNRLATLSAVLLSTALALSAACSGAKETIMPGTSSTPSAAAPTSLHALKVKSLDGKPADLSQYKGQVLLVVNTASECGYTPQYEGLQALYEARKGQGLVVLGFPSNDFGGQEPGSATDIQTFCKTRYGVTFPLFEKVVTKSGAEQSPVYAYLGSATGNLPNWNFCKYLVGKDGKAIAFYPSKVTPDNAELLAAIDAATAAPAR